MGIRTYLDDSVVLKNTDDFYMHKARYDVEEGAKLEHDGSPKKYPCKVTTLVMSEDGCRSHYFSYKEGKKCPNCDYQEDIWVDDFDVEEILQH